MVYGFLFGFLFVALVAVGIVLAVKGYDDDKSGMKVSGIITAIASLALFLCIPFSFNTIDSGEIAVVKEMGKVIDTREAGVHFDFWMVRTYEKYDTKVRQIDIVTSAYTAGDKDSEDSKAQLQPVDIQMTVHYTIMRDQVKNIAINYGGLSALESRITSVATEKVKVVVSEYMAADLISKRADLSNEVSKKIDEAVGTNYYINITNVALTNIDFSDAFEQSVEQSMIANQEVVKAEAEAKKAIAAANGELEVAKLNAQAKIEQAKADAESQRLVAQAQADAVKLKSLEVARMLGFNVIEDTKASYKEWQVKTNPDGSTVVDDEGKAVYEEVTVKVYKIDFEGKSPEQIQVIKDYLEYIEYLSKWDGKLPTVMTDTGVMLQIPTDPTTGKENKQ